MGMKERRETIQTQFANAVTQKENGTRLGGSILRAGGLVAFPTETVYGLGANGLDGAAVRRTAGKPSRIAVSEEPFSQGNSGLHFLRVQVVDKDGNVCPEADHLINFSTKGEGWFVAAANGDAANLDLFHLPKHHAFAGELTVIVEGNCTLTATAKGLKTSKYTIH